MEMGKGFAYMVVGATIGAGAMMAYYQMQNNGSLKHTMNKVKNQAQDKLGNMM